jgi:CDP-diacylglycerol--glycerol-3-phosphate 3-phosphatidyltransferase
MGCNAATELSIPWSSVGPILGAFGVWIAGLVIYALRSVTRGRYRSRRVEEMGGTRLLGSWLMEYGYWMIHGLGALFVRLRVGPNALTTISLLFAVASAATLYLGWFGLGGWLMIGAALFDLFDGMVARELGIASEAGEFFDSIVDRYSELLGFIAVMGYYFPHQPVAAVVVGLAMIASIMITFNRAKGEAQGVSDVPSGLMRRHERALYIGVGTAFSPVPAVFLEPGAARPVFHVAVAAYALVAVLGNITAVRLAVQIHRRLRAKQDTHEVRDVDTAGEDRH